MAVASDKNPIHSMKTGEFAHLVQLSLFTATGGRDMLSHAPDGKGGVLTTHSPRLGPWENKVQAEIDAAPPDDPLGPPKSMISGLGLRSSREERMRAGLKPTFSGGITGAFGEVHLAFIGAASHFGKALEAGKLGNDAQQQARIAGLMAQWSDFKTPEKRRPMVFSEGGDYPQQLEKELATVRKVPIKLLVGEKQQVFEFDNIRIGLEDAPLAHVLFAAGRNAMTLGSRPSSETQFIMRGVSDFADILTTTDMVHDYLKNELRRQGVVNPEQVLKDSKLSFDSHLAEKILLANAPIIKLTNVIAPLVNGYSNKEDMNALLDTIGESLAEVPPVHNAEHGARLLEAIAFYYNQYAKSAQSKSFAELGIDDKEIKRELRSAARERPFDVAQLGEQHQVKILLNAARDLSAKVTVEAKRSEYQDISLERALKTFDNAVTQQHDLSSKRGAVQKAVTYTPDRVQRFVDRVNGGATPKRDSNLLKAIDSGMNNDEFQGIMAEIAHAFMQEGGEPKRNFSQMVEDRMKGNAAKASKDIPPLP